MTIVPFSVPDVKFVLASQYAKPVRNRWIDPKEGKLEPSS